MGAVRGDIRSADLLDIRADSNIQGQIVARRLRIDDGAILKGSVEIQKPEKETQSATKAAAQPVKAEGAEAAAAPASEPSVEAEKGSRRGCMLWRTQLPGASLIERLVQACALVHRSFFPAKARRNRRALCCRITGTTATNPSVFSSTRQTIDTADTERAAP
jgi:hypothetical protein